MKSFYRDLKLGILGGGQLGRMLVQAAIDLNVDCAVLDPDAQAPARPFCNHFSQGSFNDFDTVMAFGRTVDLLTIEIEHVNVAALKALQAEGKMVFPRPETIELVQDKGLQKQFFAENNFPTADFQLVENGAAAAEAGFILPKILKMRRGGYDGQGVMKLSTADQRNLFPTPCVVEDLVDIRQEIAVIVARNADGQTVCFPPVEMAFHPEKHLVEFLFSPAEISPETLAEAEAISLRLAQSLDLVGLLAVELFIDQNGEILINEIAPRPHNSGHHTIEACLTSQFDQHLRAIINLPLGATDLKLPAVMINLLGAEGFSGVPVYRGIERALAQAGVKVHLYGKGATKPFRKMGHVTVVNRDLEKAKTIARQLQTQFTVEA